MKEGENTTNQKETGKDNNKIPALRTFKTDSTEYIKKEKISMLDVAAAGAAKKSLVFLKEQKQNIRSIVLTSAILFIIAGIIITVFLVMKLQKTEQGPAQTLLPKPYISADIEEEVTLDSLKEKINKTLSKNYLLYLAVVKQSEDKKELVATRELFDYFKINPPFGLTDSLEDKFSFVVFKIDKNFPTLIFKTKSFDYTFGAMIKWEESLAQDIFKIFDLKEEKPLNFSFIDKEIESRDVRILYDYSGTPVIVYTFVNRKYLIISSSEDALKEIFTRFSQQQFIND
ncbi:MAG: hypothetical protein AB1643_01870 [Patescibacteria group bacterium]